VYPDQIAADTQLQWSNLYYRAPGTAYRLCRDGDSLQ